MRLSRAHTPGSSLDPRADVELVRDAAAGDHDAMEELYRRHAEAAWRVAQAVAQNPDDASDAVSEAFARLLQKVGAGRLAIEGAFRPYLLSAVRNAAIDHLRRGGRVDLTEQMDGFDRPSTNPEPHEPLFQGVDSSMVASAFRGLPERWRSVLWLTEVEGMEPREVANILRITPNNAAQLAVRARAALRTRFLQAHLTPESDAACRETVQKLGAYVAGRLAARDLAAVDQHLAGCRSCQERAHQLEDVGTNLRRILLPLPLALTPKALEMLRTSSIAAAPALDTPSTFSELTTRLQKPLASISAGVAAVGVISLAILANPGNRVPGAPLPVAAPPAIAVPAPAAPAVPEAPVAAEPVAAEPVVAVVTAAPATTTTTIPLPEVQPTAEPVADNPVESAAPALEAPEAPAAGQEQEQADTAAPAPSPVAVVGTVEVGPVSATVSLDPGCIGAEVNDTPLGCQPKGNEAEDSEDGIGVTAKLPVVGETTVTVPLGSSSGSLL